MDLYLIRHTKPQVLDGVCYGQADIDVASSFDEEFEVLKNKLNAIQPKEIFSSPLQRCLKLAHASATHLNSATVMPDNRLMELNFGDWELQPWSDIPQGIVGEWTEAHIRHTTPNGESYQDLYLRAKNFLEEISEKHEGEALIAFTHAGVIRALVAEALNLPLIHAVRLQIDYGSVSKIVIKDKVSQIGFVNR
jgi:alpha-ribazole phosphatase